MWGSIGSRVKKVIAERVKSAQNEHDNECQKLAAIRDDTIAAALDTYEIRVDNHAEEMVDKVLGVTQIK